MNLLLVDDDELTRLDFENKIAQVSFLKLVRSCASATEATSVIMNEQIDLVILDVMMPGMSGLQLMNALDKERPQIILISSNKEYAVDAFEYEVTDFLVKPVTNERFFKAIARARRAYEARSGLTAHDEQHIFIKVNSRLVKIDTREILFVEALADYVTLYTSTARYTVHSTMKGMESALPEKLFFRAHNSYIIRLDKIFAIEDNCVIIGEKLIPVSRAKMKGLMQRLRLLA